MPNKDTIDPKVLDEIEFDLIAYGTSYVRYDADGTVTRIDPRKLIDEAEEFCENIFGN